MASARPAPRLCATYCLGVTQWGLEAIFNPGKRFDDDERKHLEATREEAGDASGGRRIDLGSGKVVIAKKDSGEGDADTAKPPSTTQEKAAAAREARIAERQAAAASSRRGRKKR
ncbi:MAG: hypothetical protein JWN61_2546 [Pseudonocardiales bacterium]|nr:hypothetical protein [Jatrophihabitantaceae bacterium]MCW2604411.1 hypothetical protein [Pseudonocardiales bacterium]